MSTVVSELFFLSISQYLTIWMKTIHHSSKKLKIYSQPANIGPQDAPLQRPQDNFDNFKNFMLSEFESMKSAFFKEANSFKNKIPDTSDNFLHLQSKKVSNKINTLNVLERLISHLEGQVTTLKVQLDRKDSIINILLEKLEKHDNERSHKCQCEKNNLNLICFSKYFCEW